MAWVAPVASIAGGILAGRESSKSSAAQDAYYMQSVESLQKQDAMSQYMLDRYKSMYAPLEKQTIKAGKGLAQADYAGVLRRATSDYTRSRGQVQATSARDMQRLGLNPGDPMATGGINRTNISDALALATARNMAREAERNRTRTLRYDTLRDNVTMGSGLPGLAISARSGIAGGYSGMGDTYGNMAAEQGGAAGHFLHSGIKGLGDAGYFNNIGERFAGPRGNEWESPTYSGGSWGEE